jgi:hypothetical protein
MLIKTLQEYAVRTNCIKAETGQSVKRSMELYLVFTLKEVQLSIVNARK